MNELAKMMGYKVGSGRVDFEKRRIETNERNLSYMKDYVVKKLSAADGCCTAEELMKQVKKLCVKYDKRLKEGEYKLMTVDDLVAIGKGTIIENIGQIIIWGEQEYLSWEEMDSLIG